MQNTREDDLFRESTMTFGEHLGELRTCLFRSIYGLGIGFVIGLAVGGYVVDFIQSPLSQALNRYYQGETKDRVDAEMEKLGDDRPWTPKQVTDFVDNKNLLVQEVYVDPSQFLSEMKRTQPEKFKNLELPISSPPSEGSASKDVASNEAPSNDLVRLFIWHPSKDDPRLRSKSLGTTEAFSVYIKASLLVGLLLGSPWIFFQIWNFVAAGLYPHERRYVQMYLPFSLGLFLFGASIAFFVVFRPVLDFLLRFNHSMGIDPEPRINEWLSFVMILPVGFGVGFQLPLVMLFLERIGVFTIQSYLKQWRIAVLVIFVIGALLMPPDATSMILFAFSLTFLYFGGILLCKLLPRKASPFERK
jgi:sec-independent protein translocase protein TatC